jgi:AI-2 transport protein TqsA
MSISMTEDSTSHRGTRFLVIAASLTIIVWGVNQAQPVLVLLLVSVFLAMLGTPPVIWLERKRVPTIVAVMIVVAAMIVILLLVGVFVGASVASFSDSMPLYQKRIHEQLLSLKTQLASKGVTITDQVLLDYLHPGALMSLTAGLLTGMGSALSNIVLILLTVVFMLLEASSFPHKLRAILGDPEQAFPQFTRFVDDIKRYMVIKTLISLCAGILVGTWLQILGVQYSILWGFLAFLLHYVPNIGMVFAAVPAVLFALIQLGVGGAALTAVGYLTISFILGSVVEPKVMGRRLGLSTLVVFLSLILWGSILGLIGMVLCVPITMTLKFAFENSDSTRWIAVLLGPERPAENIPESGKIRLSRKRG